MVDLSTDSSGRPLPTQRSSTPGTVRSFGSGDFQKTGDIGAVFETIFLLVATAVCVAIVYWAAHILLAEKVR